MKQIILTATVFSLIASAAIAAPNDSRNGMPSDTGTSTNVTETVRSNPQDNTSAAPRTKTFKLKNVRKKEHDDAALKEPVQDDLPEPAASTVPAE